MQKFLFCLIFFLSGCATRNMQHGAMPKDIKIGAKREDVLNIMGQESIQSNDNRCLYYITQNSRSIYFLRPSTLHFDIQKICFDNNIVKTIEKSTHQSQFNAKLHRKLKNQDKITVKDFFKEMINTSSFSP